MLHLRITCPAEVTGAVLDTLRNAPGAVHLTDFIYQVGSFSLILAMLAVLMLRTRRDDRNIRRPLAEG